MPNFFPTQKIFVVTKLSCLIRDNYPISLILTRYGIFNILFFDLTLNPAVKNFGFRTDQGPPIMKTAVTVYVSPLSAVSHFGGHEEEVRDEEHDEVCELVRMKGKCSGIKPVCLGRHAQYSCGF